MVDESDRSSQETDVNLYTLVDLVKISSMKKEAVDLESRAELQDIT